jgi:hypothetical protein
VIDTIFYFIKGEFAMWMHHYTKMYKGIAQEDIWKIWIDINNWHTWFPDVVKASLYEDFGLNATFSVQFKDESSVLYRIVKVFDGYKFIAVRRFWGATLYDTRALDTSAEGIRLVRTITLSGPLAWFWKYKMSKDIFYKTALEIECLVFYTRRMYYMKQEDIAVLPQDQLKILNQEIL